MKDDGTLLSEYHIDGSEDAFRELVSRHAGLVFSAARRQAGSDVIAEEVTQAVFCILARQAGRLRSRAVIAGWLHLTTRHTAFKALRSERRRQNREQEVALMNQDEAENAWTEIEPHLDEAMAQLRESDRNLLILRYFEGLELKEVGARLSVSANTAHKRITRALDRIRDFMGSKGVAVSTGMIASVLPANAIGAPPPQLVTVLQSSGLTGCQTSTLDLATESLNHLFLMKLKTALPIAAAGLAIVVAPFFLSQDSAGELRGQSQPPAMTGLPNNQPAPFASSGQSAGVVKLRAEVVPPKPAQSSQRLDVSRSRSPENHRSISTNGSPIGNHVGGIEIPLQKRSTAARDWALAVHFYIEKHGKAPRRLEEAKDFLRHNVGDSLELKDQFEMVFSGDWNDYVDLPRDTILFREKEPSLGSGGQFSKVYGFRKLTGGSLPEPSEGFDSWEAEHWPTESVGRRLPRSRSQGQDHYLDEKH